ncbi:16S rRNA (guanine(527)-N(7))-methyltransferase RsmG [Ponticoccus alexandrii]|uniref:16S rRNA (guanine(527)-N(7))-methyltransferase RsmG n=1 Tax=Ponticoccus alexandrii TaxID=1943633 RepID=UPI00203FF5C1|nr:16S rRNA (guanine(527)-N(7))-methyltransferase RsmG [Ponticoccus alexandrii]
MINLVSPNTLPTLVERHFRDSAQIFILARRDWRRWTDLGSGGGFPGLVVAILAAGAGLQGRVTLVESDQRKATFLRTVARETGVPADVQACRIEALAPQASDVISARALAPLPDLFSIAHPHLAQNAMALFHKGAGWKKELEQARAEWRFDAKSHTSETNPEAVILEVRELSHV